MIINYHQHTNIFCCIHRVLFLFKQKLTRLLQTNYHMIFLCCVVACVSHSSEVHIAPLLCYCDRERHQHVPNVSTGVQKLDLLALSCDA
jgi:hypothetical protein